MRLKIEVEFNDKGIVIVKVDEVDEPPHQLWEERISPLLKMKTGKKNNIIIGFTKNVNPDVERRIVNFINNNIKKGEYKIIFATVIEYDSLTEFIF